jgi:hypothetical protein
METLTLREAARRSSRSVTTLRRYIRSGRLGAEKRKGRFGPEYFVSLEALAAAGLASGDPTPGRELVLSRGAPAVGPRAGDLSVPISLFQELQMKHEQLLVQYGMVRVGGLRVLELRAQLEAKQRELEASEARVARARQQFDEETARLKQLLRRVELDQEGRGLEIAALREKVRALEMLTRNRATNATIEQQFSEVMEQMRRVDRLSGAAGAPGQPSPRWREPPTDDPSH